MARRKQMTAPALATVPVEVFDQLAAGVKTPADFQAVTGRSRRR